MSHARGTSDGSEGAPGWAERLGALAPRGSQQPVSGPSGASPTDSTTLENLKRRPAGGESFLLMHARWKKVKAPG